MSADHDIKDAGILAGFERWGWPWHGLCEGGVIGSSGKTITQPSTGNAWLIDKGLPALDMSPALVASEALAGREWRNYGLVSGGQINGTDLPKLNAGGGLRNASFIHVDADGINWLITTLGTFPATNTVRLTLSIVRFGHFTMDGTTATPITKTVDIACQDVETTWVGPGGTWNRAGRWVDLQDVWTNGARALLCVFMGAVPDGSEVEIFSAIELVLTGSGGADGNGLVVSASEVKPRNSLTSNGIYEGTNSGGNYNAIGSGSFTGGIAYGSSEGWGTFDVNTQTVSIVGIEIVWNQTLGFGGGWPVVCGYVNTRTSCRLCQYDYSGAVIALRLRYSRTIDHWFTGVTPGSVHAAPNTSQADGYFTGGILCKAYVSAAISIAGEERVGYYLLQNDTVVDKVEHVVPVTGSQQFYYGPDPTNTINYPPVTETPTCSIDRHTITTYSAGTSSWSGAICGTLTPGISIDTSGYATSLFPMWQMPGLINSGFAYFDDGVTKLGIHRSDNAAAFFLVDTVRTYGTVATPLGNKTTTLTGGLYFAWQRKTGEFAFSANPICYV
jgi:hypothetical protein